GFNSKMIINGDTSQIDLPKKVKSGLIDATEKLKHIKQIDFVHFSASDVVRHPVVAEIINAYEKDAERKQGHHSTDKTAETATESGFASYETIGQPASDKKE
ncbi:MAG: PhoH family protein, partial [Streptococcus sp.]|uniref:PhoH family protein n=1 Tax=Streptococcus sp. TaxID=1306 RepID=UPI00258C13D9